MKCLLLALTFVYSTIAFSQSMIVLKTGAVISIDDQGMLNETAGFMLPYQIKNFGGRYIVDEKRRVNTLDKMGMMFLKEKKEKAPNKIEFLANNFFLTKQGKMFTIDEFGILFENSREKDFKNVKFLGGNFLVTEKKVKRELEATIYVVDHLAKILEITVPGLYPELINVVGGQYFTTSQNVVYTVSTDGFAYSKKEMGAFRGNQFKKGGNYFFYLGSLYTVSANGMLMSSGMASDFGSIRHYGSNFFITTAGLLYTVSSSGTVRNAQVDFKISDISHFSQP